MDVNGECKLDNTYAVCPGGEVAALKAVGSKGLAGSNPVDGAIRKKGEVNVYLSNL